jgi:hypothetical protein
MNQFPENKVVANEIDHYNHYLVPNSDIYDKNFFNEDSVKYISKGITKLLTGLYPGYKSIEVSRENILSVMDSVYLQRPHTDIEMMKKQVIAFIVQHIQIEYETIVNNEKLDKDVLLYDGSFGIRAVPMLKLNNKKFRRVYGNFDLRY